jgi:twinkle protein
MSGLYVLEDDIDFSAHMQDKEGGKNIVDAADILADMRDDLWNPKPLVKGWDLPWRKSAGVIRFHEGETTLWAGANGGGKSLITGMVALDLICQRERVFVASFEMPIKKTLGRMLRAWCGVDPEAFRGHGDSTKTLDGLYEDFQTQAKGLLSLYTQTGSIRADTALAMVRHVAASGVRHVVIDSLMKCVSGFDDYNAQKDFVNALTTIGKDTGITIHLVAHTRKLQDEGKTPNKYDVSGASAVTDLVDNVLLFWRNKPKEVEARRVQSEAARKLKDEPDALLMCCKQRELGEEPELGLWFDRDSQTYTEYKGEQIDWVKRCI